MGQTTLSGETRPDWYDPAFQRLKGLIEGFRRTDQNAENHCVYFICVTSLDAEPKPVGLYIGMTSKTPLERLDQHLSGGRLSVRVFREPNRRAGYAIHGFSALVTRMPKADAQRF